jgi:hypothetical protein
MNKKMKIDPEKFAYHFVDSLQKREADHDIEKVAKERLAAYLSAYFLIEQFNELESKRFQEAEKKHEDLSHMSYVELLKQISKLNNY